ncbi:hypothetical protein RF55_2167 [Lasius niger]|uniref:Uncharacterized protein n=1 Tax=Lasius niger TaxID=67767 RepID=A0A0J7L4R3_LASNI|nr:hypothetical protein RF55_2167 [Lasius niger]
MEEFRRLADTQPLLKVFTPSKEAFKEASGVSVINGPGARSSVSNNDDVDEDDEDDEEERDPPFSTTANCPQNPNIMQMTDFNNIVTDWVLFCE